MKKKFFYLFLIILFASCTSKGVKVDDDKKPNTAQESQETNSDKSNNNSNAQDQLNHKVADNTFHFGFDSYALSKEEQTKVSAFATALSNCKHKGLKTITITGYADERGSVAYNYTLGLKRAKAVEKLLKSELKKLKNKKPATFKVVSKGKLDPVVPNATTEAEHQKNRRVEIKIDKK